MSGFTFDGVHSSNKYIKSVKTNRTLVPERKHTYVTIPFSNNTIILPDSTKQPITVPANCFIEIPSGITIFDVGRAWDSWLTTDNWVQLIFDDDPNYYYEAISIAQITVEDLRFKRNNIVTLEFLCKPQMKAVGT